MTFNNESILVSAEETEPVPLPSLLAAIGSVWVPSSPIASLKASMVGKVCKVFCLFDGGVTDSPPVPGACMASTCVISK